MHALRTSSVRALAPALPARSLAHQGSLVKGKILPGTSPLARPLLAGTESALRRFISSSSVLAYSAASAAAGGVKEIKPSRNLDLNKYLVVDVREPLEFADGYVPGAVNIPLDKILSGTAQVPQGKPLLLVCRGGVRSLKAATALASQGYKDVTSLATGVIGYQQQGLPVEHPPATEIKEVFPSKELNDKLGNYHVVDVREPHERVETGYVPTSINRPLQTVIDGTADLPTGKPLLIVCRSGKRSLKAAEALSGKGLDLTNLATGTLGWIEAKLPVQRD